MADARDGRYGVALAAVVCGTGFVLVGWRDPVTLVAGIALALGGLAMMTVRGAAAVEAHPSTPAADDAAPPPATPSTQRPAGAVAGARWLGPLVAVAVLAGVARAAVEFEANWTLGLDLADGHFGALGADAASRGSLAGATAATSLVAALLFFALAAAAWYASGAPAPAQPPAPPSPPPEP